MPRFTVASHSGGSLHDILAHRFVSSYRVQDATNLPSPLCDIIRGYCDEERDIDLFLYGTKQENVAQISQIIQHLRLKHTIGIQFYNSIIDVRIKSIPRIVQFVVTNLDCPQKICDGFDFSHLAQYYDGRDVMLSPMCIRAHQTQITRQTRRTKKSRIYKAVSRDYLIDLAPIYRDGWMAIAQLGLLGYGFADLEAVYHADSEYKRSRSYGLDQYIVSREGHDDATIGNIHGATVENIRNTIRLEPCQIDALILRQYQRIPADNWIRGYGNRAQETQDTEATQFNMSRLRAQDVDLSARRFIGAIHPVDTYAFVLRGCKVSQRVRRFVPPRCHDNHDDHDKCYHVTIHTDESQPVCQYIGQTTDRWYRGDYVDELRTMASKQRKRKDRFACDQWDKRADWHVLTDSKGLTKENTTYDWIAIVPRIFRTPDGMCGLYWRIENRGEQSNDDGVAQGCDARAMRAIQADTPEEKSESYDIDVADSTKTM